MPKVVSQSRRSRAFTTVTLSVPWRNVPIADLGTAASLGNEVGPWEMWGEELKSRINNNKKDKHTKQSDLGIAASLGNKVRPWKKL